MGDADFDLHGRVELFPGVVDMMKMLKENGHVVCALTNTNYEAVSRILIEKLDLGEFFDHVTMSVNTGSRKPHPEVMNEIKEKYPDFKPYETILIGDMLDRDILCARNVGIKSGLYFRRTSDRN